MDYSNFQDNNPLRTHKRLDDIINEYNGYIESLEKDQQGFKKVTGPSGAPGTVEYKPQYKYYHFQVSPEGVNKKGIGNVPATEFSENVSSWSPFVEMNTTNYWLMHLAKIEQEFHLQDESYLKNNLSDGVMINHMVVTNKILDVLKETSNVVTNNVNQTNNIIGGATYISIDDIFKNNASITKYIDNCIANRVFYSYDGSDTNTYDIVSSNYTVVKPSNNGVIKNLDDKIMKNVLFNLNANPTYNNASNYVCTEMITYMNVDISQYYVINVTVTSGKNVYVMAWYGDEAVCEFTYSNSIINLKTQKKAVFLEANKNYLMRIQVYYYLPAGSTKGPPVYEITITPKSSSLLTPSPSLKSNIFNICSSNTNSTIPYLPTLLYASFVTTSSETYKMGKFTCYTQLDANNKIDPVQLQTMYLIMESYKFIINTGFYDSIDNIDQYGQLPNNVYYTLSESAPGSLPTVFYIYRLSGDKRMGKTYQIDTSLNAQNQYEMKELPDKFLEPGKTYDIYQRYYPTKEQMKQAITNQDNTGKSNIKTGTVTKCQEICDKDLSCNYFYSYAVNNSSSTQANKCYIDSTDSFPSFNQINPYISSYENIQPGSSNLYIRNKEFSSDVKKMCTNTGNDTVVALPIQSLRQTIDYGSSFPYSNYYITTPPVSDPIDIEICANKKKINSYNNCFKEVLFTDKNYNPDGTITGSSACDFMKEGFNTNAISNTMEQGIDYVKTQEQTFENNMNQISANYDDLKNMDIPAYEKLKKVVDESGYSELQDQKMTMMGKPRLNAAQQSIEDNNDKFVSMNLMFSLAMLTILVLLVFIYTMD